MKTKQKTIKDLDVSILDGDRGKNYPHQDEISKDGYCIFLSDNNVKKKDSILMRHPTYPKRKTKPLEAVKFKEMTL